MLITAIVVVLLGSLATAPASAGSKADDVLADYTLTSFDGKKMKLSSLKGEVVVVNFWASWCTPCRDELPLMNEWHDAWADRGGRVVAISIDKDARKARRFAEQAKLSVDLYHDGPSGLASKLDLPSLPCTFLLDRNGKVVSVIRSSSDKELAKLQQTAESLLASGRNANVQKAGAGASADGGSR